MSATNGHPNGRTKKPKKMGRPRTVRLPPGPEPEVLKLEGNWRENMKHSLKVERPASGWPKRKRDAKAKKRAG